MCILDLDSYFTKKLISMKAVRLFLFVAVSGMIFFSCGTAASSVGQGTVSGTASQSLADVLRKNSSLIIRGSGESAKITVRGAGSINLNTEPLFIVDGVPMGNSYARANSAVNPNMIESVRVLKSQSETTIYGEDGNHGVIIIKTTNSGK